MNTVPFLISEFSPAALASLIKEVFGAKAPDITEKRQVVYIFNYLEKLNAKSIICETEYVDRDFLVDHQYYLTRSFHKYPSRCARLHFFSKKVDVRKFKKLINDPEKNRKKIAKLQRAYLGYTVIKPLPVTFIGKTCLKVYGNHEKEFITKSQKSNLFGISFEIQSIPFQEQDKTVSACATTALWSVFHGTPGFEKTFVPPPSQITLSALNGELETTNSFPNKGLSDKQLIKALDSYNLKHHDYAFSKNGLSLKEQAQVINTYLSSGFPVLATTKVYKKASNEEFYEEMGNHAITLVGISIGKDECIENLYIHDDRVGAYVKTVRKVDEIAYFDKGETDKKYNSRSYYKIEIDNDKDGKFNEIYFLDAIKVGTYHKVRVPLSHIRYTANYLIDLYEEGLKKGVDVSTKIDFEISLVEGNILKDHYLNCAVLQNKEEVLLTSLPKYIWVVQFKFKSSESELDSRVLDLLFDSTDIPLGNPLLGVAKFAQDASEYFLQAISSTAEAAARSSDEPIRGFALATIRSLSKDIKRSYSEELSQLFGKLNAPAYVRAKEFDSDEVSYEEITLSCSKPLGELYDELYLTVEDEDKDDKPPIWVITKNGTLIIGKDFGHTTLTESSPARIGGEIVRGEDGVYSIKPKSGRYAQQYSDNEKRIYMGNVLIKFEMLFQGEIFQVW